MDDLPTNLQRFELYKGASPMRLDHFQIAAHDVQKATDEHIKAIDDLQTKKDADLLGR